MSPSRPPDSAISPRVVSTSSQARSIIGPLAAAAPQVRSAHDPRTQIPVAAFVLARDTRQAGSVVADRPRAAMRRRRSELDPRAARCDRTSPARTGCPGRSSATAGMSEPRGCVDQTSHAPLCRRRAFAVGCGYPVDREYSRVNVEMDEARHRRYSEIELGLYRRERAMRRRGTEPRSASRCSGVPYPLCCASP